MASALAIVIVCMALAALGRPAAAVGGAPVILVTLSGQTAGSIHTELLSLDLRGSFAVQGMLGPGPINDRLVLGGFMDVFYELSYGDAQGMTGAFRVDSFFDVFVDVGTRMDPETGSVGNVATLAATGIAEIPGDDAVQLGTSGLSIVMSFSFGETQTMVIDPRMGSATTTGSARVDSFFDIFTDAGPSHGPVTVAKWSFMHGFHSVLKNPGPPQSPSLQADSFFDVFVEAMLPSGTPEPGLEGPSIESHHRGVDATTFSTVLARVAVNPGPINSPLDLALGLTDSDGLSNTWEDNGSIDFDCEGQLEGTAHYRTLHADLDLVERQGFQYSGESQPGPISIPGNSFFDVF